MIVVDTSVLIDFLRRAATPQVARFKVLVSKQHPLLGDLVLCEVLRGARDAGEVVRIREKLGMLYVVEMVGEQLAVRAALNQLALRQKGITLGTIDLLIGTFCIANGHRLLHNDRHFRPMVEHLGLVEA